MKQENTLHKNFDSLFDNLTQNFIFYIPSELLPVEISKNLISQESTNLLNRFLLYDERAKIQFLESTNYTINTINKGSLLDNNVFELLSKKETLVPEQFSFILEKYFEQAETYFYISDWLNTNMDQYMKLKMDPSIKGYFQIQFNHLKNHFKSVISHFYKDKNLIPRGNFDVLKTIEEHFPELFKSLHQKEKTNSGPEDKKSTQIHLDKKITDQRQIRTGSESKKKIPLISNEDAESFLLESVFNINLSSRI